MSFRVVEPGLLEVTYESAGEMAAKAQAALLHALEKECGNGPTAIVFFVRKVNKVDLEVPKLWLGVTQRLAPRLKALAVASGSLAVRAAASTFHISNIVTRTPLEVRAFESERAALDWARSHRGAR